MTQPFWVQDPRVLVDKETLYEVWPQEVMSRTRKLNAITRLVVLLTVVGFALSRSLKVAVTGIITLGVIALLYYVEKPRYKESFALSSPPETTHKANLQFMTPSEQNPLGNVMLTEINDNPEREMAPPAFQDQISKNIEAKTKEVIQNLNPSQPDMKEELFGDQGDEFLFKNSMRNFYTTPNTQIPNSQEAFAQFCYGDLKSCKDGDAVICH